jgi:hypothetical protein
MKVLADLNISILYKMDYFKVLTLFHMPALLAFPVTFVLHDCSEKK